MTKHTEAVKVAYFRPDVSDPLICDVLCVSVHAGGNRQQLAVCFGLQTLLSEKVSQD